MKDKIRLLTDKYEKMPVQVRASFWFLVCSFLQKGISVITTPIFTRLLDTAEYGNFGVFNSWLGIITVFVSLNIYNGVVSSGLVKYSDERDIFASSIQGLTLTLSIFWTIIYLLFRNFWNNLFDLTTVQMLAMLVMIWTSAVFNLWAAEQRVRYKYRTLIIFTLIASILKPVVGIIFVTKATDKVMARILGLALVELICYTGFFFVQLKKGKVFYSRKYWKYALLFAIPLIPHYLSQTVLSGSDRIIIKKLVGESEAGIYGLAYSLSQVMMIFNSSLTSTLGPWIYQKIKDRRECEISKIAYGCLVGIAVLNLLLIGFAPEVIRIFAPIEYYDAIYVIPPIAMSVYFVFNYDLFAAFEFYYQRTKYISLATLISALFNVVTNFIFINIFGYKAAGYTTLVCYMLYALFHYFMMKKICNEYMDGSKVYSEKILIIITGSFLLLGFTFLLLYSLPVLRYGLLLIIAIVLYINRNRLISIVKEIF